MENGGGVCVREVPCIFLPFPLCSLGAFPVPKLPSQALLILNQGIQAFLSAVIFPV